MAYSFSGGTLSVQGLEDILQKCWLLEVPATEVAATMPPATAVNPEQAIIAQDYLAMHAVGFGPELPEEIIRLAFILHLQTLLNRPSSEVQSATIQRFLTFYNRDIFPVVLRQGTNVGQLAQLFLPLVGVGKVKYQGYELNALDILDIFSWKPLLLHPAEISSLLQGETFTLANAAYQLIQLKPLMAWTLYLANVFTQITSAPPKALMPNATQLQQYFEQTQTAFADVQQLRVENGEIPGLTGAFLNLTTHLQSCLHDLSNCTTEIFENLISTSEPPATTIFAQARDLTKLIQRQVAQSTVAAIPATELILTLPELNGRLESLVFLTEQITALAFWSVSQVGKVFHLAAENLTLAAYYHSDLFVPKEMATIQLEKTIAFIKAHTPTVQD